MDLSMEEYRLLLARAPIMIWRSDTTGACDWFNEPWLEFRGRRLEEEMGEGWTEGVHPDDLDCCVRTYMDAFEARRPFQMEYRLQRGDGVYRWIDDRGTPFSGPEAEFRGFIGSCVDITEQVEARELLRQEHEAEVKRLRDLLPICSHCHRIRTDDGEWVTADTYLQIRGPLISHGICPRCRAEYFPEHPGR